MAQEQNASVMGLSKPAIQWLIVAGVAVLIVLLTIFIGPKEIAEEVPNEEPVAEQEGDDALHVAQQVVAGDYTYEFSGVKWVFDTESPEVKGTDQTWLKMEFADFTRNGSAISFGRPYKLGAHPGTCKTTDFIETSDVEGIPLGYAMCESSDTKREFAALQRLENVVVVMRETKGEVAGAWTEWYKIDVTEIVR